MRRDYATTLRRLDNEYRNRDDLLLLLLSVFCAVEMSSNGTSRGGGRGGPHQVARVITSAAWDLRLKRCEVAKGDLNEVLLCAQYGVLL